MTRMTRMSSATDAPFPNQAPSRHFGQTVCQLRQEAGLTQEALAEKAHLSVSIVRKIERGDHPGITTKTYRKLLSALSDEQHPSRGQRLQQRWADLVAWRTHGAHGASGFSARERPMDEMDEVDEAVVEGQQANGATGGTINYYVNQPIDQSVFSSRTADRHHWRWGPSLAASMAVVLLCLAALPLPSLSSSQARGVGDEARTALISQQQTLAGWTFRTVPYGPVGAHGSSIAAHNTRTGEDVQILVPQPGYIRYFAPLWLPTLHQLFYIAQRTSGPHEVWETPLADHGPAQPPSAAGERSFFPDCGPTCAGLAWSADGQWLIFDGPDGPLAELNLVTAQQRPLAQAGGMAPAPHGPRD